MPADKSDANVVFINRFTVHGSPDEFEHAFAESATFMRRQPGLLSYTLSRHVEKADTYVNVAHWQDERSLRAAATHPEFSGHVATLRALSTREHEVYVLCQTHMGAAATNST